MRNAGTGDSDVVLGGPALILKRDLGCRKSCHRANGKNRRTSPHSRRAIGRILTGIKKQCEEGVYDSKPEAERAFRALVEKEPALPGVRSGNEKRAIACIPELHAPSDELINPISFATFRKSPGTDRNSFDCGRSIRESSAGRRCIIFGGLGRLVDLLQKCLAFRCINLCSFVEPRIVNG